MSEHLLNVKAFLESKGLNEEAEEVQKIAQNFSFMDAAVDHALEGIKRALYAEVDAKIAELRQVADSKPDSYKGSKEFWLYTHLDTNPVQITYPKKAE